MNLAPARPLAPPDCQEAPSPNQDDRPAGVPVDMLILHYTGMKTARAAVERLRDPQARVSAHYVVEEDGHIWYLVDESRRAFHAGISFWRGYEALNGRSIGIEIVNPGHEHGYRPFPALQMAAVCELCLDILTRHPIPQRNIVAHSDVAPDRKEDPGELFDWEGLAHNGVGLWPDGIRDLGTDAAPDGAAAVSALRTDLATIGYKVGAPGAHDTTLATVVRAFQRHWRQEAVNGLPDRGTLARARAVAELSGAVS